MAATADTVTWRLYILRCADNSLYTGIAIDVERRLQQHRRGRGGAKYLQGRGPLELVFEESIGSRGLASRIEYRVKQLSKAEKEQLLRKPDSLREYIAALRHSLAAIDVDSGIAG